MDFLKQIMLVLLVITHGYYYIFLIVKSLTCTAGGSTSCITCNVLFHRELSTNECVCITNYKDNGKAVCEPDGECHYTWYNNKL